MLNALYRKAKYLSLDIVIGAVILLRFFCAQFSVNVSWQVQLLLGCSVWLIYTVDHLRDAARAVNSNRSRYQFHLRHDKVLRLVVGVVMLICIAIALYLPIEIQIGGVVLAMLSGIYLLIQHILAKNGLKEFYVAIIYTLGILMVPIVLSEQFDYPLFLLLLLLTYLNLILFSWFERSDDMRDNFKSIATEWRSIALDRLIISLMSLGIAMSLTMECSFTSAYFLTAFVLYTLIFISHTWVRKRELYRSLGDGVFLLPIIFEWL